MAGQSRQRAAISTSALATNVGSVTIRSWPVSIVLADAVVREVEAGPAEVRALPEAGEGGRVSLPA